MDGYQEERPPPGASPPLTRDLEKRRLDEPDTYTARRRNVPAVVVFGRMSRTREAATKQLKHFDVPIKLLPVCDIQTAHNLREDPALVLVVHTDTLDRYSRWLWNDVEDLKVLFPAVPLVLVSDLDGRQAVIEALQNGIRGFIPASFPAACARGAIRFVLAGGTFIPVSAVLDDDGAIGTAGSTASVTAEPEGAPPLAGILTPRQQEVMRLVYEGCFNKDIARILAITESTVKVHLRVILQKLNARNRTEAALKARRICEEAKLAVESERPFPKRDQKII